MGRIRISPVLYSSFRLSDGTYSIKFRITFQRRSTFLTTNLVAHPSQLTSKLKIKDKDLLECVDALVAKYIKMVNRLSDEETSVMSVQDISEYITTYKIESRIKPAFSLDFFEYGRKVASAHRASSGQNYLTALKSFGEFLGKEQLDIKNVTSSLLRQYERFLKDKYGPGASSVNKKQTHIRAIHKAAQMEYNDPENGIINIRDPYMSYKVPPQPVSKHRDIGIKEIQQMINCYSRLEGSRRRGAAAVLISFALCGLNFADMYECDGPEDNVLYIRRHKTRDMRTDMAEMELWVPDCILPLMKEYADRSGLRCWNWYNLFSTPAGMTTCLDRGLRLYRNDMKIDQPMSSYAFRHAWATIAYDSGISRDTINDALGHSDSGMKVTDIYIHRTWKHVWKAQKLVVKKFDWSPLVKSK